MKKILLLIAAMLTCALHVLAQNMEVVDFRYLESDMTAQMHEYEKFDQNGERAAIIKIVTSERDFTFDAGSLGIVDRETHTGEIWLYVPRQSKKLTIKHQDYGVIRDYYYPADIEIKGGCTYEMLIDLGIGRYVTVAPQLAGSTIYIDGENCGTAPLKPRYLNYGRHTVRALKDRYEGEESFVITPNDEKRIQVVNISQRDMSDHFGDVTVTVDGNADIYFENRRVASGTWQTQLREGSYTIETRKPDSDPAKTSFTVVARQQNAVKATPPTQHTGYLSIYTRPRNITSTYNGRFTIDLNETQTLPVGTYQLAFSRKGYVTQDHEYTVRHNQTTSDTVTLERVKYVKPLAFYFGGGITVRALMGVTGTIGAVYQRHDFQAFYTFGISDSDPIHCYDQSDVYQSTVTFKQSSFGLKYGYQFDLLEQLAITPQVGVSIDRLSGTVSQGTNLYADGASATCATIGVKLLYAPIQHFYLFAAPEFSIAVQKDDNFTRLSDASNIQAGGFAATLGIIVNF